MDQRMHYEKAETCLDLSEQADPEDADRLLKAAQVHAHLAGDYKPQDEWSIDRAKIGQITLTDSGGEAHSTGTAQQFPDEPVITSRINIGGYEIGSDPYALDRFYPQSSLTAIRADFAATIRRHREAQEAWDKERSELQEALDILTKRQSDDQSEIERLTYLLGSHADGHRCTCEMTDPGVYHGENMHPPEWEQDPWCPTHPDMNVVTAEVKRLRERTEKAEAAMREEVAEHDKTRATVLRLTRERDVAEARCERLSVLAEKGERYEALRAGIDDLRRDAMTANAVEPSRALHETASRCAALLNPTEGETDE